VTTGRGGRELSGRELARQLRATVAEQAARPDVQLAAAAVGLAVLGITIYRIWGRRRR